MSSQKTIFKRCMSLKDLTVVLMFFLEMEDTFLEGFFFFRILVIFAFIKRLIWGVGSQDYGG